MPLLAAAALGKFYSFFVNGGLFMVPLIACSIVAITVIILRASALRRHLVMPPEIVSEIEGLRPDDGPDAVVRLARVVRGDDSTVSRIAQVCLGNLQLSKEENSNAVQVVARHEIGRIEHGLHFIEIIIGIAPLLGLLGAVSGLVGVFGAFGSNAEQTDPHAIAQGISEALSTTVVGMAIAIPCLIAHGLLSKQVERITADLELLMAGLLAKCYHQKRRSAAYPGTEYYPEVTE